MRFKEYILLGLIMLITLSGCGSGFEWFPGTPQPLAVYTKNPLPNATIGTPYSQTLLASGGKTPYAWTLDSGTLPDGLNLNFYGVISGTPTATSTTQTFTVKVVDSASPNINATQSLTITITPALAITTTTLPNATIGNDYNQTLSASGGSGTYTWTKTGALPDGLVLSSSGLISGKPTNASSTQTFTVMVTDSATPPKTQTQQLTIQIPVGISTTTLDPATKGTPYNQTLLASGGSGAYSWTLNSGATSLPDGLKLSTSGVISGTPSATAVTSTFTVKVTDSASPAATAIKLLTITIPGTAEALAITTFSLPNAAINSPYNQTLAATNGTGLYTWSLDSGSSLPVPLTLSTSGVISGTPTTASPAQNFTIKVTDSASPAATATQILAITIAPPLAITTTSLPTATIGTNYSQTLNATGGSGIYTWSLSSGTLPVPMQLNTSGVISGTPTTASTTQTFTVTVTDSSTPPNTQTQKLTIQIPLGILPSTQNLPNATKGSPYTQILTATGGTGPYTWTKTGVFPDGLDLNKSTGVISGTPTTATQGFTTIVVHLTDSTTPTPMTHDMTYYITVL